MKNRSSLAVMELLAMVLVFALAGTLCLRAFVWAEQGTQERAQRDEALLLAQNVAQKLKSGAADRPKSVEQPEIAFYNAELEPCDGRGEYRLEITRLPTEYDTLGAAQIRVFCAGKSPLVQLEVNWQEVGDHG